MNTDYIIIGGGVYGCALAWELARAGAAVTVLESQQIASGSSGGGGARGVRADGRDLREIALARRAQELWPSLDQELGTPTGYQRIGGLRLVEKEVVVGRGGRVSLQAHAWMQNQAGIHTEVLERDELLQLEPGLADSVTHGLWVPNDGVAPHQQTTHAYASAAERHGARIVENTRADELIWSGSQVIGVRSGEQTWHARKAVMVTANTGTTTLLQNVPTVPGWAVLPQVTFIRPVSPPSLTHLIGHDSRPLALKAGPDGSVQVSGGLRGRWDAATGTATVDDDVVASSVADATAVFPELAGATVLSSEAARLESCSPDGIPVIDRVAGSENLYLASHWTSHGFALVPAVAEALRLWLLGGHRPAVLAPFSADRFERAAEAGRPVAVS